MGERRKGGGGGRKERGGEEKREGDEKRGRGTGLRRQRGEVRGMFCEVDHVPCHTCSIQFFTT